MKLGRIFTEKWLTHEKPELKKHTKHRKIVEKTKVFYEVDNLKKKNVKFSRLLEAGSLIYNLNTTLLKIVTYQYHNFSEHDNENNFAGKFNNLLQR